MTTVKSEFVRNRLSAPTLTTSKLDCDSFFFSLSEEAGLRWSTLVTDDLKLLRIVLFCESIPRLKISKDLKGYRAPWDFPGKATCSMYVKYPLLCS